MLALSITNKCRQALFRHKGGKVSLIRPRSITPDDNEDIGPVVSVKAAPICAQCGAGWLIERKTGTARPANHPMQKVQ
jgi:hypothetical protein